MVFFNISQFTLLTDVNLWGEVTMSDFRVEVLDVLNVDRQAAHCLGGLVRTPKKGGEIKRTSRSTGGIFYSGGLKQLPGGGLS